MPLALVTHEGQPLFLQRRSLAGAGFDHRARFLLHLVKQPCDCRQVKIFATHVQAADDFISHRGAEEADRRTHPGVAWNDDAFDTDFFRHAGGV